MQADTGDTLRVLNHAHHGCRLHGRPQGGTPFVSAHGATTFTATTSGDYTLRCGTGPTALIRLHIRSVLTLST